MTASDAFSPSPKGEGEPARPPLNPPLQTLRNCTITMQTLCATYVAVCGFITYHHNLFFPSTRYATPVADTVLESRKRMDACSGAGTNLKEDGAYFCRALPFLALRAQLVALVGVFAMGSTFWSVSCLPHCAPVPSHL